MAGSPNLSRDRGVPFEWWYGVALGASAWALFVGSVEFEGALTQGLMDGVTIAALLTWPLIPVAMYLDLRAIREAAAWEPATKSWLLVSLVPILNLPAAVAYCLRRNSAVAGRLPSATWRYGVYAGFLGWVGVVAADVAVDRVSIGVIEPIVFGPALLVVWLGFPVALYLDAERMRAYTEGSPKLRALVALAAVPLVSVVVGALYLGSRWWHRRQADPDAEPTLPGEAGHDRVRGREPLSPWYRRAVGVYVVYFLAVVALGSWLSLGPDLEWNVLGLVVWPAFGVVFTACFHLDNRAVREAGVEWGRTRYAYYLSVVVPAAAFWYLLSRHTKVTRARSKGLLDEEDGGDGGGDGEAGSGEADSDKAGGGEEGDGSGRPAKADRRTGGGDATASPDDPRDPHDTAVGDDAGFEWGGGSRG